jgi:hypothetical protein
VDCFKYHGGLKGISNNPEQNPVRSGQLLKRIVAPLGVEIHQPVVDRMRLIGIG